MHSFLLVLLISGCAASTSMNRSYFDPAKKGVSFDNYLVVAMVEDYDARAQLERAFAAELNRSGASGTPFYEVAGGNKVVDRAAVRAVLDASNYNAVLVTRVLATDSDIKVKEDAAAVKVSRKSDGAMDIFRYDYEEMPEPGSVSLRRSASLTTTIYDAADESQVWVVDTKTGDVENVGYVINDIAAKVVDLLRRDKIVAGK